MKIKTWRDPYDEGFSPTHPTEIELKPGFTVFVGCNGNGKTTLLHNIQSFAKSNKIPCHLYDNLHTKIVNFLFVKDIKYVITKD